LVTVTTNEKWWLKPLIAFTSYLDMGVGGGCQG